MYVYKILLDLWAVPRGISLVSPRTRRPFPLYASTLEIPTYPRSRWPRVERVEEIRSNSTRVSIRFFQTM